ncbi:MAG: oligosaccharide flippase family protein [Saprospiraceae bacterium]|nr:oligosaccharide flippase family protein [Saprospiraceae bacterium]
MGIIKRQAIKQSIVNYLGVAIGAISVVFIYPLATETVGLARFLIDTGTLLAPFLLLGFGGVTIKFFPEFKTEDGENNGMLAFILSVPTVAALVFTLLIITFRLPIQDYLQESGREESFQMFWMYFVPIAICLAFFQLLYNYSTNYGRIAVPAIFQNFIKIVLPTTILMWYFELINLSFLVWALVINYIVVLIAILLYLRNQGHLKLVTKWNFLDADRRKRIFNYALFGLFGGIGSVLAFRIDSFMISTLIDLESNGIFTIAAFIGNAIAIPTNAVNQISSPIITKAIKESDFVEVSKIYKGASVNLLVVGLLLYVLVACSVENLFHLMPFEEAKSGDPAFIRQGIIIVLLVGFARIIDMATSVNNPIINFSPYYRFGLYAILILGVFNIFTNLFFIKTLGLGIVGVALATLVALSLYNLVKLIFIYWKFGVHPFSAATVKLFAIASLATIAAYFIPTSGASAWHSILDIAIKSAVVLMIYLPLVLRSKVSPDVNELVEGVLKRFRK